MNIGGGVVVGGLATGGGTYGFSTGGQSDVHKVTIKITSSVVETQSTMWRKKVSIFLLESWVLVIHTFSGGMSMVSLASIFVVFTVRALLLSK